MDLGWKVLIPVSLGWLLMLAAIRLTQSGVIDIGNTGADVFIVVALGVGVLFIGALLLSLAIRAARQERLADKGLVAVPVVDGPVEGTVASEGRVR